MTASHSRSEPSGKGAQEMARLVCFVALLAALALGVIASVHANAEVGLASFESSPGPYNPNEPSGAPRPPRL